MERAVGAGTLILTAATSVAVGWLVAGVALHLVSQVVRMRGWWHILRAAYPDCRTLRARDVTSAYLAGAGLNGLLPVRAGDLIKLAVLHTRMRGSRYATLAATSVPETVFETLCGAGLVAWALAQGFMPIPVVPGEIPAPDVSWYLRHPATAWLVTVIALWTIVLLAESLRRRYRTTGRRLGQGLAIFRSPRGYMLHVAGWQALGRIIRLASLACFLAAFALPVTPRTALLVMAAQGGGRVIPIAPVSAGLRIAMLSYGLVELSGRPVDPAAITAFTFGVSAVLFVVMLAISLVLIGRELQTRSPRLASAASAQAPAAYCARARHADPGSQRVEPRGSAASARAPPSSPAIESASTPRSGLAGVLSRSSRAPHPILPRARRRLCPSDQAATVSAAGTRNRTHRRHRRFSGSTQHGATSALLDPTLDIVQSGRATGAAGRTARARVRPWDLAMRCWHSTSTRRCSTSRSSTSRLPTCSATRP